MGFEPRTFRPAFQSVDLRHSGRFDFTLTRARRCDSVDSRPRLTTTMTAAAKTNQYKYKKYDVNDDSDKLNNSASNEDTDTSVVIQFVPVLYAYLTGTLTLSQFYARKDSGFRQVTSSMVNISYFPRKAHAYSG